MSGREGVWLLGFLCMDEGRELKIECLVDCLVESLRTFVFSGNIWTATSLRSSGD